MKSETLQLLGALDEAAALNVARVLNAVNGVSKVVIATASGSVNVDFNNDATSKQELRAVLQRAGFSLKPVHGEGGSCCGGCGGS
ncbi:copper chaperone [Oxalobacteraceae bacterium R-40]|uniref:Copper chaperone n=1 Tax=Keguizhuia sedimenti TaxID=3064264 RepID=A0ABU1BQE3_9BURK|nr:copper chaperone [Oxalobacteraceae bacterium R-40]